MLVIPIARSQSRAPGHGGQPISSVSRQGGTRLPVIRCLWFPATTEEGLRTAVVPRPGISPFWSRSHSSVGRGLSTADPGRVTRRLLTAPGSSGGVRGSAPTPVLVCWGSESASGHPGVTFNCCLVRPVRRFWSKLTVHVSVTLLETGCDRVRHSQIDRQGRHLRTATRQRSRTSRSLPASSRV